MQCVDKKVVDSIHIHIEVRKWSRHYAITRGMLRRGETFKKCTFGKFPVRSVPVICQSVSRDMKFSIILISIQTVTSVTRPQIERDYPLNLSILLSGGKETNQDSLSSGE